jgi:HEAT repeat protein
MQLARYLLSDHDLVRSRAIGVIHNISADVPAISALRESMCIAPVISLLSDSSPEVVESAVGTLQNMSREEVSRLLILDQGALDKLLTILLGNHIQTQVWM